MTLPGTTRPHSGPDIGLCFTGAGVLRAVGGGPQAPPHSTPAGLHPSQAWPRCQGDIEGLDLEDRPPTTHLRTESTLKAVAFWEHGGG